MAARRVHSRCCHLVVCGEPTPIAARRHLELPALVEALYRQEHAPSSSTTMRWWVSCAGARRSSDRLCFVSDQGRTGGTHWLEQQQLLIVPQATPSLLQQMGFSFLVKVKGLMKSRGDWLFFHSEKQPVDLGDGLFLRCFCSTMGPQEWWVPTYSPQECPVCF
jgi:hypothetical protein